MPFKNCCELVCLTKLCMYVYIRVYIRGLSGKYPAILNISRTGRVALM